MVKNVEDLIKQIEFAEQRVFTEEEKRVFRIAYKLGLEDGKPSYPKPVKITKFTRSKKDKEKHDRIRKIVDSMFD